MAPSRRKGSTRASAATTASRQQWKIGDLVLAKMKGFPAWPAMISEPEKWGFSSDGKKLLVYFYGTKQIAFCNYVDIEAFTEEKKNSLLIKRQGKGSDFVRAVEEIIDVYESLKKQTLARADSDDGENGSNALEKEHLEDAGINSFGKIVETSLSSSVNHHSESASVTDFGDMGRINDAPGSLLDSDNHNKNVVDDYAKNISILDQLRKTQLSSIATTRKRARDALFPRSITKSDSSLRRSRSSLVSRPCKSLKSSMQVEPNSFVRCSAVDILLEGSRPKELVVEGEHLVFSSVEASSISTGLPFEDFLAVKPEETDLNDGNVLEFSGKVSSDTDTGSKMYPDENVQPFNKDGTPSNSLVIKSMRNPHRKEVNCGRAAGEIDDEIDDLIVAQSDDGSHSDSLNSGNGKTKKFSNEDGDGHLPLVKRARVRLGKTPAEEGNLNGSMVSEVKLDNLISSNGHYESTTFSSPVNNFPEKSGPPKRPSPVTKEVARSPTNGSADDNTGRDLLSCKRNIHHLMLDVESALPPSKRLYRALEAMSANAAEAAIDCLLVPTEAETRSYDWFSSTENVHHIGKSVWCPMNPHDAQFSGRALDKNACALSSRLTSQNLAGCCLTSLEVIPDDTNSETLMNSLQENSEEIITGSCCQGSFTSNVTGTSKSSSIELIEKCSTGCEPNHSLSPKATNTCNSQQLAGLSSSGGAATVLSTTTTVCSSSEIDGAAACSDIANIGSSATDMNVILSVSSATDNCYLPNYISGAAAASVTTNFSSTTNDNSMSTISSRSDFEQSYRVRDMQNGVLGVKQTLKDRGILSKLAPIKDLIAAAQAKRVLSRSTFPFDSVRDGKVASDAVLSPKLLNKEDSAGHGSPSIPIFYQRPGSDDQHCLLENGIKTSLPESSRKMLRKYVNHSEANAARRCFESLLCTLSRTKESIGRATRLAIDCAKYGIAGEVIDILLQYLEKESSLHKRVDLFFLVDSIAQCSRCQRGGPGDVYPSLVQAVLPRLLSAAAPPGNAASENRWQCLKVLRLWLERRTLPEFTVRHHIRELEYGSEASLSISYSRRPARTERPLNDPVREMEGMLVDEYGSNASFQLPQFLNTRILEDGEGSDSDEKSFEAVTPDMNAEIDYDKGMTPVSANKHRLVLEDVDGELEMEDVAPSCGLEPSQSSCYVKRVELLSYSNNKCQQNNFCSFDPPLPEERPPSPPPLPSSPPPVSLPCSSTKGQAPHYLAGLIPAADNVDFDPSGAGYPTSQQTKSLHCSSSLSDPTSYSQGYVGQQQQLPQFVCSCISSGSYGVLSGSQPSSGSYGVPSGSQPTVPVGNNSLPIVNMSSTNKVYHLQPPPPVVSNQFSYIQAQPQHRPQALGTQSSYSDRFHLALDIERGNFVGDGGSSGPVQVDACDRSAFYPSIHAGTVGLAPDMVEAPHAPAFYGPHLEQSSAPSQDWSYPPSYPLSTSRPTLEKPVSGVAEEPTYWRTR